MPGGGGEAGGPAEALCIVGTMAGVPGFSDFLLHHAFPQPPTARQTAQPSLHPHISI